MQTQGTRLGWLFAEQKGARQVGELGFASRRFRPPTSTWYARETFGKLHRALRKKSSSASKEHPLKLHTLRPPIELDDDLDEPGRRRQRRRQKADLRIERHLDAMHDGPGQRLARHERRRHAAGPGREEGGQLV
jgi:hypothetical protein